MVTENVVERVVAANGQEVEQEVAVQNVARIDPLPPTPDEVEQVQAYIAEENPEPAALERFDRDSLRRRPRRGRPEGMPHVTADGKPVRDPHDLSQGRARPSGRPTAPPGLADRPGAERPSDRRPPGSRHGSGGPPLTAEEQQRVLEIVRQHFDQQSGEPRPAEYSVERARGGYRVEVQFLHPDDSGQLVPYAGGECMARVSRDGRVLKVVSGIDTASAADL